MSARLALLESAKKVRAYVAQHPGATFVDLNSAAELAGVDLVAAIDVLWRQKLIREEKLSDDSLYCRYFAQRMEAPQ